VKYTVFFQSSPQPAKRNEVPANAVPLEAIKFEAGANIEAMDGYKWYKAKIVEVCVFPSNYSKL